jgi:molybdenum cofactor cytidylyltransferase
MRVVAAVLAAGGSSRLGRPKQLLDYKGEPLIRHAARVAVGVGCDETLVVWGSVRPNLTDLPVTLVENPAWSEGIGTSIRAAVSAAGKEARVLFTLCDQPLVTEEHLRRLVAADAPIVATAYAGAAGVPAVFAPRFRDELLALRGDRGARSIIDRHRAETMTIPFEDAAVDIDTEEDVKNLP